MLKLRNAEYILRKKKRCIYATTVQQGDFALWEKECCIAQVPPALPCGINVRLFSFHPVLAWYCLLTSLYMHTSS